MATLVSRVWEERRRLVSFGIIGVTSLVLNVGLYALLSRFLWTQGSRTLEYTLVTILVTWLNYEANRFFTFDKKARDPGSIGRFVLIASMATGLNSFLFWLGHVFLQVNDFVVIVCNAFLIALFTFTSHRLFTFHERPWRLVERLRR